jgi:shikimate kinase
MERNIALVGFMGTGKTTLGRSLAERLNMQFLDTDELIEKASGMPVSDLFLWKGELFFRELERQVIAEASTRRSAVIAVGGGAVESIEVRRQLKNSCLVVLLTADTGAILERTAGNTGRPLLDGFEPEIRMARVVELLESRARAYGEVSDIVVDTSGEIGPVFEKLLNWVTSHYLCTAPVPRGGV